MNDRHDSSENTGISRRSFATAAAWAAPVAAIAIAAPMAAAATAAGTAAVSIVTYNGNALEIRLAWASGSLPNGTVFSVALTGYPSNKNFATSSVSGVSSTVNENSGGTITTFTLTLNSTMTSSSGANRYARFTINPANGFSANRTATVLPATVAIAGATSGVYTH